MVALRGMAAAAVAIAGLALVAGADRPQAAGSDNPSFLFFTGTDFWRYGAFLNGGLLWSPAGVDTGGFTGIR